MFQLTETKAVKYRDQRKDGNERRGLTEANNRHVKYLDLFKRYTILTKKQNIVEEKTEGM